MTSAKERLVAELHRRRGELVELCATLVCIPSENPPGNTTRIADFAVRYLRARGVRPAVYEPRRSMPNVVATLGRGAPNLVLSGHLDEFPAGEGWSVPPFSGRIRGGRIWGRGAGDMRAGLAVALFITGFRLPPGLLTATVLAALRRAARGVRGTAIEVLNQCESCVTSPDERLVRLVVGNARALRGLTSLPVVRPGYTDGRFFRRAGIPTVVYGPRVKAMGGPDESIEARELVDVAAVHLGVVLDYLGIGA